MTTSTTITNNSNTAYSTNTHLIDLSQLSQEQLLHLQKLIQEKLTNMSLSQQTKLNKNVKIQFGSEVLSLIFSFLPISEARKSTTVCKLWNKTANHNHLWLGYANQLEMKQSELDSETSYKNQVKPVYLNKLKEITRLYAKNIIQEIGLEVLYNLPVACSYQEKEAPAYPNIWLADSTLKHSAYRGVVGTEHKRSFIAIKYVDNSVKPSKIHQECLFQRFSSEQDNWAYHPGRDSSFITTTGGMFDEDFEYLGRLLKEQPCGPRTPRRKMITDTSSSITNYIDDSEESMKLFQGKSIVHLL